MPKISRPILYVSLLSVVAYAAVFLTEPKADPKKKTKKATAASLKGDGGDADVNARFPRYARRGQDAFMPKVKPAPPKTSAPATSAPPQGNHTNWMLTGISVVDSTPNGVLENKTTHEIQFVKRGERWNGYQVADVENEAVILVNAQKQRIRLTFADPSAGKPPTAPASNISAQTIAPGTPPTAVPPDPNARAAARPNSGESSVN